MIDYKQVVNERYNKEKVIDSYKESNVYSLLNPVGFYTQQRINEVIRIFLKEVLLQTQKEIDNIKVLDAGCGKGGWTRGMLDFIGNPNNLSGMEYSDNRIRHCRDMNPAIHYFEGDITKAIISNEYFDGPYDGIVCADVLMHIRQKKDVLSALKNMRDALEENGILLWYDTLAKTHFDEYDSECQGFSEKEMDMFANECGLELVKSMNFFKQISIGKHKFSTVYNINDNNKIFCRWIEKMPFGRSVVTCRLYKKV